MSDRVERAGLRVDVGLSRFIESEVLPGTGLDAPGF